MFLFVLMSSAHAEPANGSTYVSGVISENTTWTLASSPYIITGHTVVETNITLTIEPGVSVMFNGTYYLWIKGILKAVGTPTDRIIFTSNKAIPSVGDWTGIFFSDSSMDAVFDENGNWINGSIIRYAIIEYGGGGSGPSPLGGGSGGVLLYAACPLIDNNIFRYNGGSSAALFFNGGGSGSPILINNSIIYNSLGVNIQQGSPSLSNNLIAYNSKAMFATDNPTISYNAIVNNLDGIEVALNGPNMKINHNDLYGNGYDVHLRFDATTDVNATYNYWDTTNTTLVDQHIYDYYDDPSLGKAIYSPILSSSLESRSATFQDVHLRTLKINTNGVSSSEPVNVTKNGITVGTVSDISPLNITVFKYVHTDVGANETRLWSANPQARYKFLNWTGVVNSSSNLISVTLTINSSITIFYKTQYLNNFAFKDNSGATALYTDPANIKVVAPNGTLVTLSIYSNLWLDAGNWTLKEVKWQGNNVKPIIDPTYIPSPGGMWTINCRVYQLSFSNSFKDNDGNDLYTLPSSFKLTFPNGTTSALLNPNLSYYIQNGTTTWSSIIWQGTEVVPEVASFGATNGNPTVNCRVYSLTIDPTFNDNAGSILHTDPSSWVITFPNGTEKTVSSSVTFSQTQTGNYSIASVVWQGTDVAPDVAPTVWLTSNTSWSPNINCKVYSLSFAFTDESGSIEVFPSYWLVEAPNGTISELTGNISQGQVGTWKLVAVMWRGTNVVPSVNPTILLESNSQWAIECRVYLITISWVDNARIHEAVYIDEEGRHELKYSDKEDWRAQIRSIRSDAEVYIGDFDDTQDYLSHFWVDIEFPNGTTLTVGWPFTFLVQNGTCVVKKIIWHSSNIIPSVYPTFDAANGNPIIATNVYSIRFGWKDTEGVWTIQPFQFTIQFPNGTLKTVTSSFIHQTENGTYTITEIMWQGYDIVPATHPSATISSDCIWIINCEVASNINVYTSASTMYVGFQVNISGVLNNWPAGYISGVTVILSYRVPGVSTWNLITSITTESDGSFSAVWIPSATGRYTINASWVGNEVYPGASALIDLAVTSVADRYVFSVTSNSTVSALAFNSTSRELSFTVSGPSGTRGYVKVTIAKDLVANATDIKVYLDGSQIYYTVESLDDSWLLHFTYMHSDHAVTIGLGLTPTTSWEQQYSWILIAAAVAVAAMLGFVGLTLIKKKRLH